MERLAGAPGAGQGGQQDGGGSERHEPVWERPWSLEEIRNSSESWSLAADAGLLNFLQEFSQQTISKTHEIEKQLDGLIRDTKTTNCRLHNVFNDFLMLSNTQFIENRVYDEDIAEPVPKSEVGDKPEQEKTREQKEAELIPKVQEAVNFGLQVLDSAFEQLDIKAGNSDSEEEEINERVDPILEPKDLYIDRPLPYIIGSKLFMEQEDVGLGDFSSEEGSIDSDRASGVDSEDEQDERESDDNSDNRYEEQRLQTVLSDEDDDDGSNLFDSEKEEDEDIIEENAKSEKRPRPTSFADELAARIKGDTPNKPNEEQESLSSVESITKKQVKGKKETRTVPSDDDDDDDDDDMFKPPKLTDEDFSPFGTQGGLFSGGRGLFDDDEEDLFVEVPKAKKEKEIKIKTPVTEEPSPSNPVRKVPVGGVSLFPGADPMFNPSSVLAEKDKSKTVTPKTETAPKLPTPSSGLFDDDDDDFFGKPNTKPSNAGKSAATVFVQEGDAELFSEKPVLPPLTQSNATTQSQAVKEKIGKKTPSPEEPKTLPQPSLKTQTKGLFSDEEDAEDLFLPSTNVTKSKASTLPASKPSKALSLFDDEDEDSLFSAAPVKTQITIKTPQDKIKAEEPIKTGGSSLFSSDEEDNWNRAKTVKPIPEQTKKDTIAKPSQPKDQIEKVEKKASLFDWDSAKTTKPISEQTQKDNIAKQSQPKDQIEKVEKKASLFDWDSAKTTKPISEQTQKDNIAKPSQPKDQIEKVEKKASLFDWDSAKTTKPISEQTQKDNIAKPSQPKDQIEKVEKKASLFDWDSAKTTKPISEQTQKDNIAKQSQPKDQIEKVEKKASLFDEEEDDLFAITKKDCTKKSQRASLLFEEEATNDVTLFPAVPASSPPSLPSLEKVKSEPLPTLSFKETKDVLVPKTERKSPEVKTEAEKKPEDSEVLGKPDVFVEPKKEKVDTPVSTIPDDDEDDDDLFLRLPPPDVEDKKVKKNVLSLFDEDDDDDNFEDQPVNRTLKKEIKMPSEERHHSKSTGVFQDEELLFSHKLQMDNDPDVDLFANAKKPASEKSAKLSSGAGLFGDEDEDDLFATTKPKPPPMTPEKKMGSKKDSTDRPKDINKLPQRQDVSEAAGLHALGGRQEKLEQKPADPGPIKTKDPDSRIGKLQANLTINPATLLPGAAFKAPGAKPTSSAVGVASQRHGGEASDTGSSAKSKKERVGVSFDHPANVSTLHSANKDRIKVAGKRRPPSRAGRRLASQDSGETEEVTAPAPAHPPFAVDTTAISDTKWSQTEEPKANRYKAERAVKDVAVPPPSSTSDVSSEKSARISEKVSPADLPDIFHSDDLFAKSAESKTTVGRKSKEKSNEGLVKKHRKAEKKSSLPVVDDQGSDDDLFQSTKPKSTKTSAQPSLFGKHGEEDLFANQKITKKKEAKTTSGRDPKQQIPNIFEDDIFASEAIQPAKKIKEKEKRVDIFDDDDMDIFADLTVKPKEKMTKKKVEPKSIFDDDMDDIFASGNKVKTSKSQTEKSALEAKSEKKGSFDDPLNAFGGP